MSGYKVAALALDAASLEAPVTQYGVRISPYRWTCPATRRFGKKGSLPIDISLASMSCYSFGTEYLLPSTLMSYQIEIAGKA